MKSFKQLFGIFAILVVSLAAAERIEPLVQMFMENDGVHETSAKLLVGGVAPLSNLDG